MGPIPKMRAFMYEYQRVLCTQYTTEYHMSAVTYITSFLCVCVCECVGSQLF